eukprot:TRINITY_DN2395_c0_g1_i2.p1 TRINITY_DN2395_c0_g1~~TRINITY_DN2395_c0_g1_i2.p1  ORF type:complete len:389 (-),score=121.55 TRINITY_DN2395_c0_g1_i2:39-1205(-)
MAGKKGGGGGGGKATRTAAEKKKTKVMADKTFGLKNKNKSKKVQGYVQQVQKQAEDQFNQKLTGGKKGAAAPELMTKKQLNAQKAAMNQSMFRTVGSSANAKALAGGADPKSVLCSFFKAGTCRKGAKCKFSHDLTIERKSEKVNMFADRRKDETPMEDSDIPRDDTSNKTDIICKFFLQACEERKYGWFWKCPNGETCMYQHSLTEGYVLKRDRKKEEVNTQSLEERVDEEREKLTTRTQVTLERFLAWKKKKAEEAAKAEKADAKARKDNFASGNLNALTGRELFQLNSALFVDDESASGGFGDLAKKKMDDEGPVRVIHVTGTSISSTVMGSRADNASTTESEGDVVTKKEEEEAEDVAAAVAAAAVAVDESLFLDDVDDDELFA